MRGGCVVGAAPLSSCAPSVRSSYRTHAPNSERHLEPRLLAQERPPPGPDPVPADDAERAIGEALRATRLAPVLRELCGDQPPNAGAAHALLHQLGAQGRQVLAAAARHGEGVVDVGVLGMELELAVQVLDPHRAARDPDRGDQASSLLGDEAAMAGDESRPRLARRDVGTEMGVGLEVGSAAADLARRQLRRPRPAPWVARRERHVEQRQTAIDAQLLHGLDEDGSRALLAKDGPRPGGPGTRVHHQSPPSAYSHSRKPTTR